MALITMLSAYDMINPLPWGAVSINIDPKGYTITNDIWSSRANYYDTPNASLNTSAIQSFVVSFNGIKQISFLPDGTDTNALTLYNYLKVGNIKDAIAYLTQGVDNIVGAADGGDKISAGASNDIISIGNHSVRGIDLGNETIDGGIGNNIVKFNYPKFYYSINRTDDNIIVKFNGTDPDIGLYILKNVQAAEFSDTQVSFDQIGDVADGVAADVYSVYETALKRPADPVELGFWVSQSNHGVSYKSIVSQITKSDEFNKIYGEIPNNADFVGKLYKNALNRDADDSGLNYWTNQLDNGATKADVVASFSASIEHQKLIVGSVGNGVSYHDYSV